MNSHSWLGNTLGSRSASRLVVALAFLVSLPLPGQPWAELLSRKQVANDIYESVYSLRTGIGANDRIQVFNT